VEFVHYVEAAHNLATHPRFRRLNIHQSNPPPRPNTNIANIERTIAPDFGISRGPGANGPLTVRPLLPKDSETRAPFDDLQADVPVTSGLLNFARRGHQALGPSTLRVAVDQ